jgi:hypothetical protein
MWVGHGFGNPGQFTVHIILKLPFVHGLSLVDLQLQRKTDSSNYSINILNSCKIVPETFILVGLGTRFASVPLICPMAVAVFYIHSADPFSTKEMAVLYLLGFSFLLIAGGGKYSLDSILAKRSVHPAK